MTGGIHIHDGKACSVDAAKYISNVVGGHYWDSQDGTIPDPWSTVYSTATTTGKSWGSVEVSNVGYDLASVRDHSIVIHDSTGARVGCGVLERSSKIHGYAYAVYDDSKIKFTANFGGARFMAGSLFGVHVHTGRTCDAPEGHLMIGGEDPWKDFKYAVKDALPNPRGGQDWNNNVNGKFFSGRGYIHAEASGVPRLLDIKGRTVVAHAATGDKIACGILSETSPSDPSSASHGSSLDVGKMSFTLVTAAAGFLFCF